MSRQDNYLHFSVFSSLRVHGCYFQQSTIQGPNYIQCYDRITSLTGECLPPHNLFKGQCIDVVRRNNCYIALFYWAIYLKTMLSSPFLLPYLP